MMWIKLGLLIATIICGYNLPADCLHPQSSTNRGIYETEVGIESYYCLYINEFVSGLNRNEV